ncbi:MAG: biotin/lipoyl-binding protein [Flavobacteriales bacterium]|nr:biotin/lipoyl-binding protein [Flavobacteriales bacterium]
MIKIIGAEREFEFQESGDSIVLGGKSVDYKIVNRGEGSFELTNGMETYAMDVVRADYSKKEFEIRLNGTLYSFKVKDRFDAMLKALGIEIKAEDIAEDIKAPMPGLVLSINVKEGTTVKKGETVLVLEAMKMENSIKSTFDGVVKSVLVKTGQAVEKNQVLIVFES